MQGSVVDLSRSLQHIPLLCFLKTSHAQAPCLSLSSLSPPTFHQVSLAVMIHLIRNFLSVSGDASQRYGDQYVSAQLKKCCFCIHHPYMQCYIVVLFDMVQVKQTSSFFVPLNVGCFSCRAAGSDRYFRFFFLSFSHRNAVEQEWTDGISLDGKCQRSFPLWYVLGTTGQNHGLGFCLSFPVLFCWFHPLSFFSSPVSLLACVPSVNNSLCISVCVFPSRFVGLSLVCFWSRLLLVFHLPVSSCYPGFSLV